MANTNFSENNVHCYEDIEDNIIIEKQVRFWVDGVLILIVGGFGIIGNVISTVVLRKCPGNKCFNVILS